MKKCDSSVANELLGPLWDDINLKDDGVVENKWRACKPVVELYASVSEQVILSKCLQYRMHSNHDLSILTKT